MFMRVGRAVGWALVIVTVMGLTWAVGAESWSDTWGASRQEVAAVLPGDGLIEEPAQVTTRAVDVRVPPGEVWPWVAQIGQGRGGLYSYDWVERLIGVDMTSADRVLAEHQDIAVGDQVWITQPGYPADIGMVVAEVQPGRALVLASSTPSRPALPEDAAWTWSFVLEPGRDGGARLVVRNRTATMGSAGDVIWDRIVGPIGFAMERQTLRGIAGRAERAAGLDTGWSGWGMVWLAGLVTTGLGILVLLATRTPTPRKAAYVVVFTAAATLVLFRFTSAAAALVLAGLVVVVTVLLARAWPRQQPTAAQTRDEPVQPRELVDA